MNAAELQYLADHLTPEESRELVAAAHLKGVEDLNILEQAEPGEGKGESHEILEHRLRQMGKDSLAEWLELNLLVDMISQYTIVN